MSGPLALALGMELRRLFFTCGSVSTDVGPGGGGVLCPFPFFNDELVGRLSARTLNESVAVWVGAGSLDVPLPFFRDSVGDG